ncbi:MAG: hypothetical protein OWQ56_07705 [Acidithiobacillus caldus]|nr:hypothetical protein [Acidithiobacillus caldus]
MRIVLCCAASGAAPLALAAESAAAWQDGSVWKGEIAKQPVHVCFQSAGWGLYYYDKYQTLIALAPDEGGRVWRERVELDSRPKHNGAVWRIGTVTEDSMSVDWERQGKTLHFTLTRVPLTADDAKPSACATQAFNAPRYAVKPWVVQRDDPRRPFIDLSVDYGPAFNKNYSAQGFLLRGRNPQARRFNAWELRHMLEVLDGFYDCQEGALVGQGSDGSQELSLLSPPRILAGRFLQWAESHRQECAIRPGIWTDHYSWDLREGKLVPLNTWFSPKAVVPEGSGCSEEIGCATIEPAPALRALLLAAFDKDPDSVGESPECRDVLSHASYQVEIGRDGLYFTPAFLPLVIEQDCSTTLHLPFVQLKPLLSPHGRQQMKALLAGKKGGSGKK